MTPDDPPLGPGMLRVRVDTRGRLLELVAAPPHESPRPEREPDWSRLLALTGMDTASLRPAPPARVPPVFGDRRVAWADREGRTHVEAAALGGRPVFFTTLPAPAPSAGQGSLGEAFAVLWYTIIFFGSLLAARNLRLGRGDRQGASRIAAWAAGVRLLAWLLLTPHTGDLRREQMLVILGMRTALFSGAQIWLLYMAIEPALRRRWPACLVSWTRLLQGRWRDPLVGRDVLAGLAGAVAVGLLWGGARVAAGGSSDPVPIVLEQLLGLRGFAAWMLTNQIDAIALCLWLLVLALLFQRVLRDFRVAAAGMALLFAAMAASAIGVREPLELAAVVGVASVVATLLLRFGMLAVVTTMFFLGTPYETLPSTLDFSAWYGEAALAWLVTGYALATWGLLAATGGRPFPRTGLLDD